MFKRITLLFLFISVPIFSQYSSNHYDFDFDVWELNYDKPFIEFNYGQGEFLHNNLYQNFQDVGDIELKLGYTSTQEYYKHVSELDANFFSFAKINNNLVDKGSIGLSTEAYRFGFGKREGFGYLFKEVAFTPYSEYTFTLTHLKFQDNFRTVDYIPNPHLERDLAIRERFNDRLSFGYTASAGVKLDFYQMLAFTGGYEVSVIFPRYLFWKHMGSFIIQGFGYTVVENFVNEILDSSPGAAPIVNFLLKNGINYAFYELQKDDMNWPFETETPVTFESFKFGVTLTF